MSQLSPTTVVREAANIAKEVLSQSPMRYELCCRNVALDLNRRGVSSTWEEVRTGVQQTYKELGLSLLTGRPQTEASGD